ncbi:hypothetical protein [Campylobacter pinnipediorum]|uniref:hypothetical protein n=1 Tax=Campylobacter pinnipediorum TaxID=1965231 RepID=UPI00084D7899|nr:hypothetical protein [Campylobacter pinnipediorum]AQW80797.1 hypothetical protein CPIN17260_0469 [Campylobacter pinnipediorum subsp. pinnipediorum]AQW83317.1 hypothetical protein CPIN17261_1319 [Campylobacter pinnipediorum subsp. pinnipediorum]OPA75438.1 hypothetical protein BFG05_06080 [Campylobacter pinnipediorum subsp. pinnipediorum]
MKEFKQFILNYPKIAYYVNNIDEYKNLKNVKAIIGDNLPSNYDIEKNADSYEIYNETLLASKNKDDIDTFKFLLSQTLENKIVLVELLGYCDVLPLNLGCYLIIEQSEFASMQKHKDGYFLIDDERYYLVETSDEKELNDLYKNNFKYSYHFNTKTYTKIPDEYAYIKFFKGRIRNRISNLLGDLNDLLADNTRLLYVLFNIVKEQMNKQQREQFKFIIDKYPSEQEINNILQRLKNIDEIVWSLKTNNF